MPSFDSSRRRFLASSLKHLSLAVPGMYYGNFPDFFKSKKLESRILKGDYPDLKELHKFKDEGSSTNGPPLWSQGFYSYFWNRMAGQCLESRKHLNKIISEIARFGGKKEPKVQKKLLLGLYMILSFGVPQTGMFVSVPDSSKLKELYGQINRNNDLTPNLKKELIQELGSLNDLGNRQFRTSATYLALHALSSIAFGMCTARLCRDGKYRENLESALKHEVDELKNKFEDEEEIKFQPSEYLPIDVKSLIPARFSPDNLRMLNKKIVLGYTPRKDYKVTYINDIDKLNLLDITSDIVINAQDLLNPGSSREDHLYRKPIKSDIFYLSADDLEGCMQSSKKRVSAEQAKEFAGLFFRPNNTSVPLKYLDTRRIESLTLTLVDNGRSRNESNEDPPAVYLNPDFSGFGSKRFFRSRANQNVPAISV